MKDFTHPFHLFLWLLLLGVVHASSAQATGWLSTSGNHIVNPDASVWIGRGANLHDTRSCGGGTNDLGAPINDNLAGVTEVKRRIDVLTDVWKASFIRLALESRRLGDSYFDDLNYRSKIKEIVDYIGTKPGVYVLVSIWQDPSLEPDGAPLAGAPTAATNAILAQLATDFYASPHVLYGVSNEPQNDLVDAQVWTRMNAAVAAIRAAEDALGGLNHHIVTVQGTREWARDISYYAAHPIAAGGGANVAYETHIYNSPGDFASLLLAAPGPRTIPVIVGEFGPINDIYGHTATVNDMQTLIDLATANNIPYLAWTFHQYCPPNLIADTPGKTWDANSTPLDWHGMPIYPTDFGQLLKDNLLAAAPGADIKLSNGIALNTTMTAAVSKGSWKYYYIDLPSGSKNLVVDLYNLSADLDLYVRHGSKPIESTYDCRSILGSTSNDQCSFTSPMSGRWWIGVYNYATGTISYTVKAKWSGGAGLPWLLLLLGN